MDNKQKIENLIGGITVRLDQLVNFSRQMANQDFNSVSHKKHPILKYLLSLVATFVIIVPTTFQINSVLNAQASKAYYRIHGIYDGHTKRFNISWDYTHNPEQIYQYSVKINGAMDIYKGQVKKIYMIYSDFDGDPITEKDFYPIAVKEKQASAFTYLIKSIPYVNFSNIPLFTDNFTTFISYHSSKQEITKPVYILNIDNQNNINISVLLIRAKATTINHITDRKLHLGSTEQLGIQKVSKLNFKSSEQILDSQNSNSSQKLDLSVEQFKKDCSDIQAISRQYFGTT